jgi:hypothetical protein
MGIKNKAESFFFYFNVTANASSSGTDFLILVSWNIRLGPSKINSLSNVYLILQTDRKITKTDSPDLHYVSFYPSFLSYKL